MRIVAVSDTHDEHKKLVIPDGDVFIHAGDLTNWGDLVATHRAFGWINDLPHEHKVVIAGNHDKLMAEAPELAGAAIGEGITYLEDSGCEIGGLKFWGSPYVPTFGSWSFMLSDPMELKAKWDLIPEDTDVLITHGPARGMRDFTGDEHAGCEELMRRKQQLHGLRLHVCGHIHQAYGVTVDEKGCIHANAAMAGYEGMNTPLVFDL